MKVRMIGETVRLGAKGLFLVCLLVLLANNPTMAQYLTATNWADLSTQAFDGSHSIYLPWMAPGQWRAFSFYGAEPAWVCSDMLQACTNLSSTDLQLQGMTVTATPILLTKNVLTGVTLVQSTDTTDIIASVAAPSGYYPGILSEDRGVLYEWVQATNCPDCWGLSITDIPPPTVTLTVNLADLENYPAYASNLEAEAEAQSDNEASTGGMFTSMSESGGMMLMDSYSCDDATNMDLAMLSISQDTNGWTTLVWGPTATNYLYEVQAAPAMLTSTTWIVAHTMIGDCGTSTWTDQASKGQGQYFWRVRQLNFNDDADGDGLSNIDEFNRGTNLHSTDTDGDGIPDGWEVAHGLNPLDPSDASADFSGDGLSNLQKYLWGLDPAKSNAVPSIAVNAGQFYTTSLTIPIQPLSTNYPKIRVGFDQTMTNVTLLTNSGGSITYTLPDSGDGVYNLYLQYADSTNQPASTLLAKTVTLDRLVPVVDITSPASNSVLDQAFINLQAVASDADPTEWTGRRPLSIWVNDQPYWDRSGTNIVIERFSVPSGTNSFTVTIRAADEAGHTGTVSRTWAVNTSGDTVAPQLTNFNIASSVLLPDVGQMWMEAAVDDSNAIVDAIVMSDAGDSTTNALHVRRQHVEGLVSLESGTNTVVVRARDAAGNGSSNTFTVIRSDRFSITITNPVFGAFVTAPSNTVSGYVNLTFDAGLPTQTNVTSVLINGVAAVLGTNLDANGNVSFRTTNAIAMDIPIAGTIGGPGIPTDPAPTIPPAMSQAYEVTHHEESHDDLSSGTEEFWYLTPDASGCWITGYMFRRVGLYIDDVDETTGDIQDFVQDREDEPPSCLTDLNPDHIAWQIGDTSTFTYSYPGPLDRGLSFGMDYIHGQGSGGLTLLVYVPGPCCCPFLDNGLADCSLPDRTDNNLCHGWPQGTCPDAYPNYLCIVADHYETQLRENAVLTRSLEGGALRFRAPRQYDTNTTVIFTFEGMEYARPTGTPLDLSQVKFRGQDPFSYSNAIKRVSYILTVDGGSEYTINQDDFQWPAFSPNNVDAYSSTDTNCYAGIRADWFYGPWAEDMHQLWWNDFHNAKPEIDIVGMDQNKKRDPGGLVVCNCDSNSPPRSQIVIQKLTNTDASVVLTIPSLIKVFTGSTNGVEVTSGAVFANAKLPTNLWVEGQSASTNMHDMKVTVAVQSATNSSDYVSFTVAWVVMAAGKHSGSLSSDNAAANVYYNIITVNPQRLDLGPGEFNDRFGRASEFRGDIQPANIDLSRFGIAMHLARTKDVYQYYSIISSNGSDVYYHNTGDDTSDPAVRDDDPKPNDRLYDFDNPGVAKLDPIDVTGSIRRYRGNFHEFAVFGATTNRCSVYRDWYSKQSWQKGTNGWFQINDIANDNANGDGQLNSLTWDMQ